MKLLKMLRSLLAKVTPSETDEVRSIVILQRQVHRFSEDELRTAGERGWSRKFDGKEDSMYFVAADNDILPVIKAGPHIIRVVSYPMRYVEDDGYALSQLPQPEQRKAWIEHHAFALLDFFNDLSGEERIPDAEAYASLATLALQLGDPNRTAIFVPNKNIMMPNDGSAEQGLRLLINKEMPMGR